VNSTRFTRFGENHYPTEIRWAGAALADLDVLCVITVTPKLTCAYPFWDGGGSGQCRSLTDALFTMCRCGVRANAYVACRRRRVVHVDTVAMPNTLAEGVVDRRDRR
jgi:hypothetical protein